MFKVNNKDTRTTQWRQVIAGWGSKFLFGSVSH